ncbi:MAG TPA: N-6 DNA methylase [Pyrinomonadaceae bacterium]|nr:N-6 DNA methylase [Pyrinomonadaceae bacterium]
MLDTETKRRIDTARDILVGKIPNPQAQIEQITIALIYKFMDDMDKGSVEMGGKASFFVGDYEKYAWNKIFDPRLGGFELVALYGDAIEAMDQNPSIPQLFRDIFKNAYLPYRDPETLKLFLKTINDFQYDHSERLGDAYEYLLSVLGSQGDAGQFRTPRHIIDFIVSVVDPQKGDRILDPACGTAGFLISAYKHIVKSNPKLSATERTKLMRNLVGYDISPDMVRLSLVNMFLHQFPTPDIVEYDTLTSEDRWNDYFDVIIANPPFMSPKGGIKPHKRFSVQAKRSEVLFVDYIAEHINPKTGRAGIIVPEGIIFQSANAYKELRKMLVEKHFLYAVVSLPAGVFNPYSGVKTSILFFDKQIAAASDSILFVKIQNDGFNLGAQRREISGSELPEALAAINTFRSAVLSGQNTEELSQKPVQSKSVSSIVKKTQIAEKGEFNLSGDRYVHNTRAVNRFEFVSISEVAEFFVDGNWIESKDQSPSGIRLIQTGNVGEGEYLDKEGRARFISEETFIRLKCTEIFEGDVLISRLPNPVGRACLVPKVDSRMITAVDCSIVRFDKQRLFPKLFVYYTRIENYYKELDQHLTGSSRRRISRGNLGKITIPLPPMEVQKEIVAKIEGWQKIIDGARAVVDNYKPEIPINPTWPFVHLHTICRIKHGFAFKGEHFESYKKQNLPILLTPGNFHELGGLYFTNRNTKRYSADFPKDYLLKQGDLVIVMTDLSPKMKILGNPAFIDSHNLLHNQRIGLITITNGPVDKRFVHYCLSQNFVKELIKLTATGSTVKHTSPDRILECKIPLPPLEVQQEIVTQIEKEQELINANKQIIKTFEQKIKDEINKLWEQ